jgi:HAD superfamily hydrolase (TIGR01450 family)
MTDLLATYDALLLDLDGTVYRGAEAVPGAPEVLSIIRKRGTALRFVTNNASRSPKQVAEHLVELGIETTQDEVCTSAQAAAAVLAERLPAGSTVLVVGAEALVDEIRQVGLKPATEADGVDAVVQGLSKDLGWRELSEATIAVRAGALWVACNVDATLPTERGQLIGNGALVAAVATATGKRPEVAGKPGRPLMDRSRGDAEHPLVVGDRLDTDIEGAKAAGLDALVVLSGVSTPADLLDSPLRPKFLAADVTDLTAPADELAIAEQPDWAIDGDTVRWTGGDDPDPIRLLRALCAVRPQGPLHADDTAAAALTRLGLADRLA